MTHRPVLYHFPICPFSQRVEILLELKGKRDQVEFQAIDITQPRPDWLLQKTRGSTALPVLDLGEDRIIKESLVIMRYLEEVFADWPVLQPDPYRRAVENMLVRMEGEFTQQGYAWIKNQDAARRADLEAAMLQQYARLNAFLLQHATSGTFLFETFGWAEAVFTPMFMRFWCLEYYEDFKLPTDGEYQRVGQWVEACIAHPAAQQVSREEVVKLYYDYAKGAAGSSLLPGRQRSSFALEPHWRERPWPPRDKYGHSASDAELGL